MRVSVNGPRIVLHGAPKSSPTYGSLPSARWNKKEGVWTYFASPIAAARLKRAAGKIHESLAGDQGFFELLAGFRRVRDSSVWKTQAGVAAVEQLLANTNPFHTTTMPWKHQVCADSFLFEKRGALLAMEMGTGKTLCAIEKILALNVRRTLVVAPLAVCEVWPDEWNEHTEGTPHKIIHLNGNGSAKRAKQLAEASFLATACGQPLVAVINYESFWREPVAHQILETVFDLVIYDECHKLKSPSGKASRFAARLAWLVPWRLGLSGTPIPNNPLDAFGVWRALDPSMYGTIFVHFRNLYAKMGGFEGKQVVGWLNKDRFKRIMDFATFRVDIDVLDLPEATDTVRHVLLPDTAKSAYNQLAKDFVAGVRSGMVTASNALSRLVKLREITCGFVIDDDGVTVDLHHARDSVLAETFEEIGDEPVVVFCEFKEDVERVKSVCDDMKLRYGEVTGAKKDTVGGKFPPDTDVLICNTRSGGLGLNLVAARYAVFYSVGFSLSDHLQARRRVHRGGQHKTVTYIHLVSPGTVDEQVYQALKSKKKVIDEIMNAIKGGM